MMTESDLRNAILSAGGRFRICPHCKGEFVTGIGRPRRKYDAKFCCEECRYGYGNAKRYAFIKACREEGVAP